MKTYHYTIRANKRMKTYTIRKYENQHCIAKWKAIPAEFKENKTFTQNDIEYWIYHDYCNEIKRIK